MTTELEKKILCHYRWMSLGIGNRGDPFVYIDGDGVFIVPVTDNGEVVMIVEPSGTEIEPILGLPGGTIEDGEQSVESANRELQEESGFKSEQLDYLGTLRPLSRYSNMKIEVYLGRKLSPSKMEGDEPYKIEVKRFPFEQIPTAILSGQFNDSNVISALYLSYLFLERESVEKKVDKKK